MVPEEYSLGQALLDYQQRKPIANMPCSPAHVGNTIATVGVLMSLVPLIHLLLERVKESAWQVLHLLLHCLAALVQLAQRFIQVDRVRLLCEQLLLV